MDVQKLFIRLISIRWKRWKMKKFSSTKAIRIKRNSFNNWKKNSEKSLQKYECTVIHNTEVTWFSTNYILYKLFGNIVFTLKHFFWHLLVDYFLTSMHLILWLASIRLRSKKLMLSVCLVRFLTVRLRWRGLRNDLFAFFVLLVVAVVVLIL